MSDCHWCEKPQESNRKFCSKECMLEMNRALREEREAVQRVTSARPVASHMRIAVMKNLEFDRWSGYQRRTFLAGEK